MGYWRYGLAVLGVFATSACGSHSSSAPPAPVTYGQTATQPGYSAPEQSPYGRTYRTSSVEPARLDPVTAVYQGDASTQNSRTPEPNAVVVQRGDTVYGLARRFNVKPQEIIQENGLRAPYTLSLGQVLKLPKSVAALSEPTIAKDVLYSVKAGDTLYSISRASKVSVAEIASVNGLRAPYNINVGQGLRIPRAPMGADAMLAARGLQPNAGQAKIANNTSTSSGPRDVGELARNVSYTSPQAAPTDKLFDWPVRGAIVSSFGDGALGRRNDGVNIAAPAGTAVRAAANGEVVYRGSEIEGFGNLLLVKHLDGFVTAYAHNESMLVKKGDRVRQGQIIAKVGQSGSVSTPQLHFEIRQNLKSVDPVALLGAQ
ncbi:MAG: M23 family metallopeptidase [Pseudomonadota bacterium]